MEDVNGKSTTTPNAVTDYSAIINTLPEIYGGFQNTFRFKSIQLDILLQFVKQIGVNAFFNNGTNIMHCKF